MRGRVLFIDKDNLNTDGIYGSKHTYRDDMTPEQMAAVTFENYDPNFNTLYQKGDVVVGGLNFGSGSSREQAATALKFKGIPCVIAGSFSETYKRNAFNNGFVVFECPELVTHLRTTLTNRAAHDSRPGNHHRLRKIRSHRRRKIIPLPAAQSRRAGIDRRRRRRKARRVAVTRKRRSSVILEHRLPACWRRLPAVADFSLLRVDVAICTWHSASHRMQHASGVCSPELVD